MIRRITGQRLGEFFARRRLRGRSGADFHIGLPPSEFHRVAKVVPAAGGRERRGRADALDPDGAVVKTSTNPPLRPEHRRTRRGWRRAEIGAANGHGNARSVARIQSAVACGGEVDGVRLLSPTTIDRVFEVQSNGIDLVLGIPHQVGRRLHAAPAPSCRSVPNPRAFGHGGWGGSLGFADLDARVSWAYVMNKMAPGTAGDTRALRVDGGAVRRALTASRRTSITAADHGPTQKNGAGVFGCATNLSTRSLLAVDGGLPLALAGASEQ